MTLLEVVALLTLVVTEASIAFFHPICHGCGKGGGQNGHSFCSTDRLRQICVKSKLFKVCSSFFQKRRYNRASGSGAERRRRNHHVDRT